MHQGLLTKFESSSFCFYYRAKSPHCELLSPNHRSGSVTFERQFFLMKNTENTLFVFWLLVILSVFREKRWSNCPASWLVCQVRKDNLPFVLYRNSRDCCPAFRAMTWESVRSRVFNCLLGFALTLCRLRMRETWRGRSLSGQIDANGRFRGSASGIIKRRKAVTLICSPTTWPAWPPHSAWPSFISMVMLPATGVHFCNFLGRQRYQRTCINCLGTHICNVF